MLDVAQKGILNVENVLLCFLSGGQGERNTIYLSGNETELMGKTEYHRLWEWGVISAASETDWAQ